MRMCGNHGTTGRRRKTLHTCPPTTPADIYGQHQHPQHPFANPQHHIRTAPFWGRNLLACSVGKFSCSSPNVDVVLQLATKPPSSCVAAAAAAPHSVAGVLAVSRPVYMEVRWCVLALHEH